MIKLDVPRLQITWTKEEAAGPRDRYKALYEMVLYENAIGDIRANNEEGEPTNGEVRIKMGETIITGGSGPINQNGLDTPFRDGVHMSRDATLLNLPSYVVYGSVVEQIRTLATGKDNNNG